MSENETLFDGGTKSGKQSSGGRQPVLTNDEEGVAAWINTDKNGNAYLSVRLPLGLGNVALFPSSDRVRDALNQLHNYLSKEGN